MEDSIAVFGRSFNVLFGLVLSNVSAGDANCGGTVKSGLKVIEVAPPFLDVLFSTFRERGVDVLESCGMKGVNPTYSAF